MTNDEQQRLLKYLTPVDTVQVPNRFESYLVKLQIKNNIKEIVKSFYCQIYSLKSMFDSPQFKENLSSFQKLLEEGVFDLSLKNENGRSLKKLALCNAMKSEWVEKYNMVQV